MSASRKQLRIDNHIAIKWVKDLKRGQRISRGLVTQNYMPSTFFIFEEQWHLWQSCLALSIPKACWLPTTGNWGFCNSQWVTHRVWPFTTWPSLFLLLPVCWNGHLWFPGSSVFSLSLLGNTSFLPANKYPTKVDCNWVVVRDVLPNGFHGFNEC